jgi:hypothetical protein
MVERSVVRLLMLDVAADEFAIEFGDGDHGLAASFAGAQTTGPAACSTRLPPGW